MYLADGYDNTRVIKYDMDGNILAQWGEKGEFPTRPPGLLEQRARHRRRPHDPARVRQRPQQRPRADLRRGRQLPRRVELFHRPAGAAVDIHSFIVTSDRKLWAADQGTHKILGYDLEGHFLYSWGSFGTTPAACGVHGMSTTGGEFYTASGTTAGSRNSGPGRMPTPRSWWASRGRRLVESATPGGRLPAPSQPHPGRGRVRARTARGGVIARGAMTRITSVCTALVAIGRWPRARRRSRSG